MKIFKIIMFCLAGILLAGCGSDEPDPDSGGVVKPDQEVADPSGTVTISMRNDDETSIDGLVIGDDNNFHGDGWSIASVGSVNGLGNVFTIPSAGWASKVAVIPGQGYVAYNTYNDTFYRIFVIDYLEGATTGGIVGAAVKYQRPFTGIDQSIAVDNSTVVLPADGGMQQIVFSNTSIVPFDVVSSAEWCQVKKASTRNQSFLYDAIVISSNESYSVTPAAATVTIETLYGKKTEINVTRAARGEFITLSQETIDIGFQTHEHLSRVNLYTNIVPEDISIESNAPWLSAKLSGETYVPARRVLSIEGTTVTRAALDNPVSKNLLVTAQGYAGAEKREGIISLSHGSTRVELKVIQAGSQFTLENRNFEFEAESSTQSCRWSGNLYYSDLTGKPVNEKDTWVSVSFDTNQMYVTVLPNYFPNSRTAVLNIEYDSDGTLSQLGQIEVTQKGMETNDMYIYFESKASNYSLEFFMDDDVKITSTADWCTATFNGSNLVIRATSTTENRAAVITLEGINMKIYVSQSKYKVGDEYNEDGVAGRVYSMGQGIGRIIKYLDGKYVWSTEFIDNNGARSDTDGKSNTAAIMSIPGWKELYPAFAAVDALNTNGITGWYLPARNEFDDYYNWSSTESSATEACRCGEYYGTPKHNTNRVTAMHQFSYDFNPK